MNGGDNEIDTEGNYFDKKNYVYADSDKQE